MQLLILLHNISIDAIIYNVLLARLSETLASY